MTAWWDCCLMLLGQGWEMIYISHAPRTDPTAMTKVMPLGEMLALVQKLPSHVVPDHHGVNRAKLGSEERIRKPQNKTNLK